MEKQWYYTIDQSDRQGPVPESELRSLMAAGTLKPSDMVWSEGMADWASAGSALGGAAVASASPAPAGSASAPAGLPDGLLGWMNFVGIVTIIMGVFSLCNFLIGIFFILAGVSLLGARTALLNVPRVDPSLAVFFDKLRGFFKMTGIFYIIAIVLYIVIIVAYFGFFAVMMSQMSGM